MTPKELEVYFGKGVSGTLAVPFGANADQYEDGIEPATHKMALILHGQGGHRNYCYQKLLAHRLAKEGIYSLRIDFRGCGSSADNADDKVGRVLTQDVEDIQDSVEFLIDGSKNPLKINFTLSSIISHSRGSVAMFLWALEQDELIKSGSPKGMIVPNLINCSSRFQSHTVLDRYPLHDEEFVQVPQMVLRHGKFQPIDIMKRELLDLAEADLSKLNDLSLDFSVLSIYGLEDNIIPIVDSSHFANVLNRGHLSHKLELIPMADHNFFGTVPIENEVDAEDYNPENLPLNKSNLVNYSSVVVDKIIDYLRPENELLRFLHVSKNIGHLSRWKQVEGISNFRDIGGWKLTNPRFPTRDPSPSTYYVTHNLMFRCANTGDATPNGLATLQKLGITAMFDLRSDGECARDGYPKDLEKYGIKRIHAPVFSKDDYSPQSIAVRYANLMTSWNTYVNVYDDMLNHGAEAYRRIFEYIRDENKPFVFHCTAGKDRTGMVSMLILLLSGLDHHVIAKEYELTTIGLKPDHAKIKGNFMKIVSKMKEKMGGPSDFEKSLGQGRKNFTIEEDGFNNLISSRYEAMLSTIELFNDKYGGIMKYMTVNLGFNEDDILKIFNNIVINDKVGYLEESFLQWSHRNSTGPNL
ncbi:hypothetical protein CLIB1444_01S04676 [[Candida] jaroonii]|uniref:Uncharacterized protein n=1 Tax=[Candida] jaroonii TaxID=467808 RepID=A0ACA9Y1A5_9ASCO|nr:hypothetical protein CLIB1444_01S04676 [[Candida] jaroonii]